MERQELINDYTDRLVQERLHEIDERNDEMRTNDRADALEKF